MTIRRMHFACRVNEVTDYASFFMAQEPLERQGLLVTDDSRSNSGTPHSVGHLCTSDYPSQRS
jgi:hypothetical protein